MWGLEGSTMVPSVTSVHVTPFGLSDLPRFESEMCCEAGSSILLHIELIRLYCGGGQKFCKFKLDLWRAICLILCRNLHPVGEAVTLQHLCVRKDVRRPAVPVSCL